MECVTALRIACQTLVAPYSCDWSECVNVIRVAADYPRSEHMSILEPIGCLKLHGSLKCPEHNKYWTKLEIHQLYLRVHSCPFIHLQQSEQA